MPDQQSRDAISSVLTPPGPHVIVIFGASGDLSKRRLLPGLFHLHQADFLTDCRIIGASRSAFDDDSFRDLAREACETFSHEPIADRTWDEFMCKLSYVVLGEGPTALAEAVSKAEGEIPRPARRLHYLSVPPRAALALIRTLADANLVDRSRIIMEKPFGTDLESAKLLNAAVHEVFDEDQIFRIDHFLGKEAAQNILALRFANGLFEPIWNRNHIDHVQIDVPEQLTVGDRAGFYEGTGAYRDMVVTHLLQILGFVAMEPPVALEPGAITEEKNKVFRTLKPIDPGQVVRGQYEGYRSEPGVAPDSTTETLIALKCEVDNWRWSGVPFYLRTGKAMAEGARIISIAFHEPPKSMFPKGSGIGEYGPDHLTFDLDESSRISLSFYGKRPGPGMTLEKASLQFSLDGAHNSGETLEAYERLIRDAMSGDHTLFTTADGIEHLWDASSPLLENPPEVLPYPVGSWGPEEIHEVISPHYWRLPFARPWRE